MKRVINIISLPGLLRMNSLKSIEYLSDTDLNLFVFIQDSVNEDEIESLCKNLLQKNIINSFKIIESSCQENIWSSVNCHFRSNEAAVESTLMFFLSADIELEADCLKNLTRVLCEDSELAGVNPLLLAGWIKNGNKKIAHMGTVFDCQKMLHFLYEGIEATSPLIPKQRHFQLAHPSALLIRQDDFRKAGGFQTGLKHLAFPSLCLSLRNFRKKGFSSISSSRAILQNAFDSWYFCASWNSTLQRGRLDVTNIKTDYPDFARDDGLSYRIDSWLNEYAVLPELDFISDAWLEWRHRPQPLSLLKYLYALSYNFKEKAIELARSLPSSLPKLFEYYPVQCDKIAAYAKSHKDEDLLEECESWQKKKKRFHQSLLKRGMQLLKEAGLYNCSLDQSPAVFDAWTELAEKFDKFEIEGEYPEIAVLMPVWNPEPDFLIQAIESVLEQDYPKWQLCMADDASTNPQIAQILRSYANRDNRIKTFFRETNGHICQASNSALKLVSMPYTAFMDNDDMLVRQALLLNAEAIKNNHGLSLIYSDEDHIDIHNVRRSPIFRPDYDKDLFFIGHLSNYRTDLLRQIGAFRPGTEGSQNLDLFLRASDFLNAENVHHIPHILYHWRVHEKSTAGSLQAKPYILDTNRKVLLDDALRKGLDAQILVSGRSNFFRMRHNVPRDFKSNIIIYTDRYSSEPTDSLLKYLQGLRSVCNLEILVESASDSWHENCVRAVKKCDGEIIAFLYAGIEPLSECGLEQLLIMARRSDLALVGGLIWYENLLYNGGWYPDINALPFPLLQGLDKTCINNSVWGQFLLSRHVLGVSRECMVIKRELLEDHAFLNKEFGELATVDFAMRQFQTGRYSLASPWGQWKLRHGLRPSQIDRLSYDLIRQRWGREIRSSGLRNANLRAAPDKDWTLIL